VSSVETQLFNWAMAQNLSGIVRFHNFVRGNLAEFFRANEGRAFEQSVIKNYDSWLAANAFLMAYSYFEEYLFLLWKFRAKKALRGRSFSIDRYKPVLTHLGIDLQHPSWTFLEEKATNIRHCLLHANGRVSFMKEPFKTLIRKIVREYPGELSVKTGDRLIVNVRFTRRMVVEIQRFQELIPE